MKKVTQEVKDEFNKIYEILQEKLNEKNKLTNEIKKLRDALKQIKDENELSSHDIQKKIRCSEKYENYHNEYYKKNKETILKKASEKCKEERRLLAEYKAILKQQK